MGKHDKLTAVGVLTGVTMLVGGANPAEAAVMTMTATPGTQAINVFDGGASNVPAEGILTFDLEANQALTFNQFDPAQGNLTSVKFSLDSGTSASFEGTGGVQGEGFSGTFFGDMTVDFTVSQTGLGTLFSDQQTLNSECSIAGGSTTCSLSTPVQNEPFIGMDTRTAPADLALFTGGGTFDVMFALEGTFLGTFEPGGETTVQNVEPFTMSGSSNWTGSYTVDYTFESVPEPSSLALLGIGLGAAAALRRRRKS